MMKVPRRPPKRASLMQESRSLLTLLIHIDTVRDDDFAAHSSPTPPRAFVRWLQAGRLSAATPPVTVHKKIGSTPKESQKKNLNEVPSFSPALDLALTSKSRKVLRWVNAQNKKSPSRFSREGKGGG